MLLLKSNQKLKKEIRLKNEEKIVSLFLFKICQMNNSQVTNYYYFLNDIHVFIKLIKSVTAS